MEHNEPNLPPEARPLPSTAGPVGVILAGGASRRMGLDKARIHFAGATLAEHAVNRLRGIAQPIVLADRGRLGLSLPSVPDGPGAGPVAGLLGAAQEYPGSELLVLACDLPQVPSELLAQLAASPGGDLWLPRWHRGPEPLCGLYRPAALEALNQQVSTGNFALHAVLRSSALEPRYLEGEELSAFGLAEDLFLNLNTPQDLERWQRGSSLRVSGLEPSL